MEEPVLVLFTGKIFFLVLIGLTAGGLEKIELLMTGVTSSRADSIILELTNLPPPHPAVKCK